MNNRLRGIYGGMKHRCYDSKAAKYSNYGGRGITICDEWLNSYSEFEKWALSNGYADDLTIDRIDVNGNYEPTNCRWVSMKVQLNNKRHYWLPDDESDFIYTEVPDEDVQRDKRERIKTDLGRYHLSQVWLVNQLASHGIRTDKTEMCSILAGTRVGAKSEYIINLSLEILERYQKCFVKGGE